MRIEICPTQLHLRKLASHFLSLTSGDRLLRFGSVLTDIDIVAYVERLLVSTARVFVVVEPDQDVSGVLTLEFTRNGARLGLSVSSWARNLGIGRSLLQRAGRLVFARGPQTLFVPSLGFNTALQQLALSLGMNLALASGAVAAMAESGINKDYEVPDGSFAGSVTLADDSLRLKLEAGCPEEEALDFAVPISS